MRTVLLIKMDINWYAMPTSLFNLNLLRAHNEGLLKLLVRMLTVFFVTICDPFKMVEGMMGCG